MYRVATASTTPSSAPLDVKVVSDGERNTFLLDGELDVSSAASLLEAAGRTVGAPQPMTLDLSQLTFIDSSGIEAILRLRSLASGLGVSFLLIPGPPAIQRVFAITGLRERLPWARP